MIPPSCVNGILSTTSNDVQISQEMVRFSNTCAVYILRIQSTTVSNE